MGRKIIQKIYICDCCEKEAKDGDTLWEMGNDVICEDCFDNGDYDNYIEEKLLKKELKKGDINE